MAWEKAYTGEVVKNVPQEIRRVISRAREMAPEALETLFEVMISPRSTAKVRVEAASIILDRALGRAPQLNFNIDMLAEREQTREQVISLARQVFLAVDRGEIIEAEVLNGESDRSGAGEEVLPGEAGSGQLPG